MAHSDRAGAGVMFSLDAEPVFPFGEFAVQPRIAVFGLAQDRDALFGREPDAQIDNRIDIADAGHRRRRLLLAQRLELH